ncbi:MAG: DUF1573 domain-containing protein [Saprospiraceae bacterium]|nr:DUF1573 domain-containing protein [Saprospiraceae bacterium]
MKKLFYASALMMGLFVLGSAFTGIEEGLVKWDRELFDMGKIVQDKPVAAEFLLENHGTESLLITRVKGSCGCTATAYEQEPILPGESGTVTATYNARAKGPFTKTVTVYTNAQEEPFVLTIKGEVVVD